MKELNLIPYNIREKKERTLKIKKYSAAALLLFSILFIGLYIPNIYLNSLVKEETLLKQNYSENINIVEESKKLNIEITDFKNYSEKVEALSKQKIFVVDKIIDIEKFIPKDIVIENYNYNGGTVSINGIAKTYNSIAEFAANLQMSEKHKTARILNESYDSNNSTYSFTINLSY